MDGDSMWAHRVVVEDDTGLELKLLRCVREAG